MTPPAAAEDLPRPTAEQLAAAVDLLSRTAATPGPEGWVHHAPEEGLLLRSQLDGAGAPQRQELHVLGEAFVWERGQGVRTGRSSLAADTLPHLEPDPAPLADRLALAARALAPYAGSDALLLNLRAEVVSASARQPRGATSTSYYRNEGIVYAVLFALFAVAFFVAMVYFLGARGGE